jgi:hypothetical protein
MLYLHKCGNMSQQHLMDLVEGHVAVQWEGGQGHLPLGPGDSLQWMVSLTDLFLLYSFHHFGETYCLHLWGRRDSRSL